MTQKPLDLSSGLKTCPQCELAKPLGDYYRSRGTMHGYAVYCKKCSYERHKKYTSSTPGYRAKAAERAREWREKHPGYQQEYDRKKNYDLPAGEYDRMLAAQRGRCAICKSEDAGGRGSFHVDHCHSTGRIRGLLCHGCNVSIGHFNHNPQILRAAIEYLNRTSC